MSVMCRHRAQSRTSGDQIQAGSGPKSQGSLLSERGSSVLMAPTIEQAKCLVVCAPEGEREPARPYELCNEA